jgi:hypothetical protein
VYTVAEEAERIRQISVKCLNHHEPEIETIVSLA